MLATPSEIIAPVGEIRLAAFITTLLAKRSKAISGRQASGIEEDWLEDEEFYQGVDDANRAFHRSWVASIKRGTPTRVEPSGIRSTVFLNVTRPYVDSAAARVADMALPIDDRPWDLKPTPVPDITLDMLMQANVTDPAAQQQVMDMAQQELDQATASADLMQTEIDDLLVECNWHGEMRMVIEDAARIGSGVLKGPFPVKRVSKQYEMVDGQPVLNVKEEIKGASKRIDPWNFFPDPACGESVHNGSYTWERDYLTSKQLMDLATAMGSDGQPLYDVAAIFECVKEGPQKFGAPRAANIDYVPVEDQFQMWVFHGIVDAEDMELAGGGDVPDDAKQANAMAILVNDRLIKIKMNVLDTGDYPYDVLAWQRRPGIPWGMGVGRHNRTPQRMLNAATRAMMDNAGDSAGMQIILGNGITPSDGMWEIRGRKTWRAEPDVVDVRQAFHAWVPESRQAELMAIIQFALQMGEQTTGMPLLLQGQQNESTTKTLGGMQLLQNNASGVMRRLAKRLDDYVTDPHIRRYYNWQMQYGTNPKAKGDFQIDVRASSALVERDAQKQFMFTALQFAKDPAYGFNPFKLTQELVKSERMDPKRVMFEEDDYKNRTSQKDPIAESQAALNQAKTKQALATAAQTTVAGLYASTEAASLVATNPSIAPVADAIAMSAGVVDANAAPLIPSPPPGTQPLPPGAAPMNTHPTFPGNPPSPLDGMNAGIEGGQ